VGSFGSGAGRGARGGSSANRAYDYDVDAAEVSEDADVDHRLPPAED